MYIGLFWCIYVSFICLICLIVIRPTKNTLPNSLHYDASSYSVCCSVLQCVAVCCSVLPCVAVCCSVLQCSVLQCSVLPPHIQVVFVGHFWCTCVFFIGLFWFEIPRPTNNASLNSLHYNASSYLKNLLWVSFSVHKSLLQSILIQCFQTHEHYVAQFTAWRFPSYSGFFLWVFLDVHRTLFLGVFGWYVTFVGLFWCAYFSFTGTFWFTSVWNILHFRNNNKIYHMPNTQYSTCHNIRYTTFHASQQNMLHTTYKIFYMPKYTIFHK